MTTVTTPATAVEVICAGSAREMGVAQGTAAKDKINAAYAALHQLEAFRLQQPRWLPFGIYRRLAEKKASRFLHGPLNREYSAMLERITGLAEGASVPVKSLMLINALEPLLSSVGGCTACPGACSAVAIRGSRSASGAPMLARNFDYLPMVQPYYLVRECRPDHGLKSIEFTTAPLAGTVDGMNEAGLCITYNYGYTLDRPHAPAAPISMAITQTLQSCRTVSEAANLLSSLPRWGGALLMLVDAEGDMASLELSSTRSALRRPEEGEDVLQHTNAFHSHHMQEVQPAGNAVYTVKAPAPLRGRRLHQSSETRDKRFQALLAENRVLDAEGLGSIMADHGSDQNPGDYTPCVHGSYWYTTACLQFFPRERRLRVAYSTACQAKFLDAVL